MMTASPKMTNAQSLYLAAIKRTGARILTQTVVADGRMSVLYELRGKRTRVIVHPDGSVK